MRPPLQDGSCFQPRDVLGRLDALSMTREICYCCWPTEAHCDCAFLGDAQPFPPQDLCEWHAVASSHECVCFNLSC